MSELETLQQNMRDLAGYVQVLAKAVLVKAEDEEEDEDAKKVSKAKVRKSKITKHGMYKDEAPVPPQMPGMEDDMGYGDEDAGLGMEDEDPMGDPMGDPAMPMDQDEELNMAYKSLKLAQAKIARIKKGYAASAKVNADEHDAPFEDKDSGMSGNEASPAGDQGGAREDETFGKPSYKMLAKQVARLTNQVNAMNGTVIAKAVVPAVPAKDATATNATITRDVQEQAKSLSYKQLNKFREEVGDLPRHGIIG
jgi:hypothetical protein